jgi:hypothetical protein
MSVASATDNTSLKRGSCGWEVATTVFTSMPNAWCGRRSNSNYKAAYATSCRHRSCACCLFPYHAVLTQPVKLQYVMVAYFLAVSGTW